MRRALLALVLVIAACGGDDSAPTATSPSTSEAPVSSTASTAATTTTTSAATSTTAPIAPAILSLSSGRGDDDTFEATIWFASDPFVGDYRIAVGADVDLGYPGVGDPYPFLNGHLELTPDGAALKLGDDVLAEGDAINELVSWGFSEDVLRVFFIETTPARGGTTWVIVEQDGERVEFGTAGAPFGTVCSYHAAGLDLDVSGVPDAGTACRYP